MKNFKQVLSKVAQTGNNSVNIIGMLRGRWHIVAAAASVLCLLFVPFERLAGGLAAHFTIAFALVPAAIVARRVVPRSKKQRPATPDNVTIKYACGHTSMMDRAQIAELTGSEINVSQLDLHVSCKQCSAAAAPTAKKKKVSLRLVGSAIAGVVVLVIVASGFTSGIANSMISQAASLSGSFSSMQNFASSGGASDLLSGKGSVEDLTSLKGAIPGGDQLELAGIEAYSFADGYVTIGSSVFQLELAGNNDEKSRGLSFSEGLKPDQAFLIENPKSATVTLLSASFTVDVLWLANNKIVDIAQGVTECKVMSLDQITQSSGSGCVYKPSVVADSVLYLDGGTVASTGLAEGDIVELTLNS
jgi:uncharacterized membrane protein (UPF0127 family)